MGLFSKSSAPKAADAPKHAGDFPAYDFIPYAAFYNDHTFVTKNGELVQTIRIPLSAAGLPSEESKHTGVYLRDLIRQVLRTHTNDTAFAHWLHVMREREEIPSLSKPAENFAIELQEDWLKSQRTGYSYYNHVYLTLVIQGQTADLFDVKDFKKGGRKRKNRRYRHDYLDQQAERLESVMQAVMADLAKHFKVERLGMRYETVEGKKVYFSEHMEWLYRLVNLQEAPMPISEVDISQQLDEAELIFGFDAMEARLNKQKRFMSMISLKHYHELPLELFDRFIQMPLEMLITQTSHYTASKEAMDEVAVIDEILTHSEDGFIADKSGFSDMMQANQGGKTDYSKQQTTIMIITDHYKELDQITSDLQSEIAQMGLLSVREDIKLEEIFWSQLPANFEFIRRKQVLPSSKVGGLARLNYYPTGQLQSRWGEPITILPTVTRTPYLFHFHRDQVGHTAIVDFNSFPDALGYRLAHFLMASASKQVSRTIMIDRHGSGEMFVNNMHGKYFRVGGKAHNVSLNPLAMEAIPSNQGFLGAWLALLLDVSNDDQEKRQAIKDCVAQAWQAGADEGFAALVSCMQSHSPGLAEKMRGFMQGPAFGGSMASGLDNLTFNQPLTAINLHVDVFREKAAVILFSLILHRIILSLDGKPTLLVVKDAWDVFEHPFFASRLQSLMDMLTERNAMLLMTTRDVEQLPHSNITPMIMQGTSTKIVLPDDIPADYMPKLLGYTETEDKELAKMERQKGQFLVVHGDEIITTTLDIKHPAKQAILLGDAKTLQAMKSA